MKTCDVCGRNVTKLATSRNGKYGLNLCRTCYKHFRTREIAKSVVPTREQRAAALRVAGPPYEWPLCELCGGDVNQHGLGYYTSKGKKRRFCSLECRNTANSRAGAPIRAQKARERVARGEWKNPNPLLRDDLSPEERRAFLRSIGRGARKVRLAEVREGRWRNPALSPEAREKLSRPRKHGGALHSALEKLKRGARVADLTPKEQEAHRAYRRELYAAKREEKRAWRRRWWRRKMDALTDEEREALRAKWREENRRKKKKEKEKKR